MIWFLCILVYTVISIWFVLRTMGYKFRKEHWYDLPLMLPTLIIAYTVSYIRKTIRIIQNGNK